MNLLINKYDIIIIPIENKFNKTLKILVYIKIYVLLMKQRINKF